MPLMLCADNASVDMTPSGGEAFMPWRKD